MDHHLLLIRDDAVSIRPLKEALRDRGYTVAAASQIEIGIDPSLADSFDLIVIDHSEPRINAMEICAELRRQNIEAPVVVLTAPDQTKDRLAIFKAGADDFLIKPINADELQVRVEALLLRAIRNKKQELSFYEFGGMKVDFVRCSLQRNSSTVSLSEREVRLLRYFVENRGKTISRSALLQRVWGYRQAPLTRTVDVHILRLRHKVESNPREPQFIVTVPGFGYRFDG